MNILLLLWNYLLIKIMGLAQYFASLLKIAALYMFYPFWVLTWRIFDIRRIIRISHPSGTKYLIAAAEENNDILIKIAYFIKFYDHNIAELQKFAKNKVAFEFCDGDGIKFKAIFDVRQEKSVLNDADILFGELNIAENLLRDEE